ncbi:hypothetical protein [Nonomuraea endophytica]|uniref:Uncharacterized protein n=1 Tax=Nonomuraea endophytica TaxID=714136 RepID=A0A7W8EMJ1_9ACTN|nr:hypothetical protein [Nonomuraea endophytica]MBB5084012.1 hypothetical protein [Nonomuraea endophytica]
MHNAHTGNRDPADAVGFVETLGVLARGMAAACGGLLVISLAGLSSNPASLQILMTVLMGLLLVLVITTVEGGFTNHRAGRRAPRFDSGPLCDRR